MAASVDECKAQFPRQQCCLDRTYSRVLAWAAYISAQSLPPDHETAPEIAFVQQRIVAERMPLNATQYTQMVAPYLMEVPNITDKVRDHLNAWNSEASETTLATDIDTSLATVMPKFADAIVSDQEVANWCDSNGYPRPEGLVGVTTPIVPPVLRVA